MRTARQKTDGADIQSADQTNRELEKWQKDVLAAQGTARTSLIEKFGSERAIAKLRALCGTTPDMYGEMLTHAAQWYQDGRFFLEHIGLFLDTDPELALVLFDLRERWIAEYDLRSVPELLLVDQALLAYFQALRMHKEASKLMGLTEVQLFSPDGPWANLKSQGKHFEFSELAAEDSVRKMQNCLLALSERFNQMFLRNLKALRELKASPINVNIGQAGQVNVAQQQVNVAGPEA